MKVVVTGCAGFVGSEVAAQLTRLGHSVVGLDRSPLPRHLSGVVDPANYFCHDINDLSEVNLRRILADGDCVMHLAAFPSVRYRGADRDLRRQRDNVDATERVVCLTPLNRPLLAFSSSSVYGGTAFGRPSVESQALHPRGGYAESKVRAERWHALRREAGGECLTVRPFTVLGSGQRSDMALSVWGRQLLSGEDAVVFGSVERTRDFVDVRDLASATIALAANFRSGVVNVASGRSTRLGSLLEVLSQTLGRPLRTRVVPAAAEEVAHTLGCTAALREQIGFAPSTPIEETVRMATRSITTDPRPAATLGDVRSE